MRARPWAWLLCAASACGRIGFDRSVDGSSGDASRATGPFGTPIEMTVLGSPGGDDDPALTADMLEICFDSTRGGGVGDNDIWCSRRADVTDPWPPPTVSTELSSIFPDYAPGFTPDGLTIFLSRNVMVGTGLDLYVATRATRDASWSVPTLVAELSTAGDDANPQPSANLLELLYSGRHTGENVRQLYRATRASVTDPWTPLGPVALNVSPDVYTGDPWVSADGAVVYFASDRDGNKEIYRVERPTPETYGVPELLGELGSPAIEQDPWCSPDERVIYFSSRRGGDSDLYMATRQ